MDTMAAQALEKEQIQKAVDERSRLAKAMAVLNVPLRSSYLKLSEENISIDVGPGRILTSRIRGIVMEQILSENALPVARHDALLILANAPLETRLVSRRLNLYLEDFESGQGRALAPLLEDINTLLLRYRTLGQSMLALHLAKSLLSGVRRLLSTESRRAAGWAYLEQGFADEALLLLNTASADPIENADRLRLRAEANKSLQRWSDAIGELGAAIDGCLNVPEASPIRDAFKMKCLARGN